MMPKPSREESIPSLERTVNDKVPTLRPLRAAAQLEPYAAACEV